MSLFYISWTRQSSSKLDLTENNNKIMLGINYSNLCIEPLFNENNSSVITDKDKIAKEVLQINQSKVLNLQLRKPIKVHSIFFPKIALYFLFELKLIIKYNSRSFFCQVFYLNIQAPKLRERKFKKQEVQVIKVEPLAWDQSYVYK